MFKLTLQCKVLIGLMLLAFSPSAMAGKYCIYFPVHWENSPFTKRDNDIYVNFQHHKYIFWRDDQNKIVREDLGWRDIEVDGVYDKWRSSFRDGQQVTRKGRSYFRQCHDLTWIVEKHREKFRPKENARYDHEAEIVAAALFIPPSLVGFRAEVKHGFNCPRVTDENHGYSRDYHFVIERRKHQFQKPWQCVAN